MFPGTQDCDKLRLTSPPFSLGLFRIVYLPSRCRQVAIKGLVGKIRLAQRCQKRPIIDPDEGLEMALCGIRIERRPPLKAPFQFLVYKYTRLFQTGRSP
jgi:hypothetical protein